jgi:hypothetical protein
MSDIDSKSRMKRLAIQRGESMATTELHPLVPQPARRVNWEENVLMSMEHDAGLTRSDAQGILMVHAKLAGELYDKREYAHIAASMILDAAVPENMPVLIVGGNAYALHRKVLWTAPVLADRVDTARNILAPRFSPAGDSEWHEVEVEDKTTNLVRLVLRAMGESL